MNLNSVGRLPLCIVVPITNWREEYARFSWFVPLAPNVDNGLTKPSGADAFQVKSPSETRFIERLGTLISAQIDDVAAAIALCVGYSPPASRPREG
jgi:mRNA interferase MazF